MEEALFTNIYAPYYRQISLVAMMQKTVDVIADNVRKNVTRTDVYAALDYFFEKINKKENECFLEQIDTTV